MSKATLFTAVFVFLLQSVAAEVRTLTNTRGLKIEAEVVRVTGAKVTIKRVSDGRTFAIPVASLVPADQAWLKSFSAKPVSVKPGAKWLPLTVEFPLPEKYDREPWVIGARHALSSVKTGASSFDMLLPHGAWVALEVNAYDGSSARQKHIVKFNGEQNWRVRINDKLLLLSRDGGPEEVAGISFSADKDDIHELIALTKRYKPGVSFCLAISDSDDLKQLPDLGFPQTAIILSAKPPKLDYIIQKNLKALQISLNKQSLPELEKIKSLEALDLRLTTLRDDPDPAPSLTYLPQVADLTLRGFPNNFTLHNTLLAQQRLRCLEFYPKDRGAVLFQGINGLKYLESLDVSSIRVDGSEFCSLTHLRALTLGSDLFDKNDGGLAGLSQIKGLQHLDLGLDIEENLEKWGKSGALSELERLDGGDRFPAKYSPGLKYVDYGSATSSASPLRDYARLPELEFIEVSGIEVDDWRTLTTFKSRSRMKAMKLSFNSLHFSFSQSDDRISEASLKKLASFQNLRSLRLRSGKFKTIDLSLIPMLEHIEIDEDRALAEIKGIDEHKKLRSLRVDNCEFLTSINGTRDNHILQSIDLDECSQLTDTSGLNIAKTLKIVRVSKCDALKDPQSFLESKQLLKVDVSGCKNLRDRRISR